MKAVDITRGDSPVILAMPHTGTEIPEPIAARLNAHGSALTDTDWHVDQLYAELLPGATTVRALFHRYVIDANRPPSGDSLYPGQNTTGLCPLIDFDNNPIYRHGEEPDATEIEQRRQKWHAEYHRALATEINRVKSIHGVAILYDCHSIRSEVPFLFDGQLPDFNIGTNDGVTCDPLVAEKVYAVCYSAEGFSCVQNGRFKGGWTTRHYGDPDNGVHAIQMELAQCAYMTEAPPWAWEPDRAARLRRVLANVLHDLELAAPRLA